MSILKKRITKISFCLLLSIFFLSLINFNTYFAGHDGLFHINRLEGIVNAFKDGQILTKIYPNTNNGYGYAVSLFYCDLFLYPFALIYKLGVPLVTSYVIMIIFYSSLSIFAMMWASSKIFEKNTLAPYLATLFFAFCNYRIGDIYVRNALGETLALCFAPFAFYAMYKIFIKKENSWVCLGISFGGIALCHNITLLIYGLYYVGFYILFVILSKNKKDILNVSLVSLKGAGLAILLSLFYLLPLLEQITSSEFMCTKYYIDQYDLASTQKTIIEIFSPEFIKNLNAYVPNLGTILTCTPFFYLISSKKNKYITTLVLVFVLTIMYLGGFLPWLYRLRFLNIMQFSWRLFIFITPLASLLLAYSLININKKLMFGVMLVWLITTCYSQYTLQQYLNSSESDHCTKVPYHLSHYDMFNSSQLDETYNYNFLEMFAAEYLPPTEQYDYLRESTHIKRIENNTYNEVTIDKEKKEFLPYKKDGTNISFDYETNGNELLMVPLTYYKGYNAYYSDGNKKQKIELEIVDKYKQVSFRSLPGNNHYEVHYEGTFIQHISLLVSSLTIIMLFIYCFIKKKNYK